jgi:hypothetical protein
MAGRPQNRLELRRQYEAAEPLDPVEDESEDVVEETDDEEERRPKKKRAPAKSKAKAAKPAKPAARMRIVWAVVNDAFKTVASFDYTQKEAALAKAAEMTAKGKGTHFVQKVKEAMPEDAPGLGAAIPRPVADPKAIKAAAAAAAAVEDEEEDEEEAPDADDEAEAEADDDDDE